MAQYPTPKDQVKEAMRLLEMRNFREASIVLVSALRTSKKTSEIWEYLQFLREAVETDWAMTVEELLMLKDVEIRLEDLLRKWTSDIDEESDSEESNRSMDVDPEFDALSHSMVINIREPKIVSSESAAKYLRDNIGPMKGMGKAIQCVLYFANILHVRLHGRCFLNESAESWDDSPVYPLARRSVNNLVKMDADFHYDETYGIDEDYIELLDLVLEVFQYTTVEELVELSHQEPLWLASRRSTVIPDESLIKYYFTQDKTSPGLQIMLKSISAAAKSLT